MEGLSQDCCLRWTELRIVYEAGPCWPEVGHHAGRARSVAGQEAGHARVRSLRLKERLQLREKLEGPARG